ncbi:MAG: hypothetical protein VB128_16650 [Sedimentibacter saalensis]|jgi:hypothetical protein|uniref:hypothetical protein n=1 Tax=Sedimentibacter saalensis TaxID=130788 RepID=UPI002B1FB189|nr:hypothetical protein [Sedimentibacter saalensis]MEA5096583.1 hypothetical protein [Sedimentibacter saalensis]
MKTEKRVISVWIINICFIAILLYIQGVTQLSFINNKYNFYAKIVILISFFVSLNKTIFRDINFLEIASFIICIVLISLISLYHVMFEQLLYTTQIDLPNNRDLIVKEHSVIEEYTITFYEKKYLLFKKPLENGPYIVTDNAPFHSGEYKTEYDKDNKVLIKYRNPRFEEYQEVIIQL